MLSKIIYNYFDSKRLEKESKEKAIGLHMAPSYMTKCKRSIFFSKTNTPASNPPEAHAYIKFELGNDAHEMMQAILKNIGIWIEGEDLKEVNRFGFDWKYKIDNMIKDESGNKYIIEIKTTYAKGFINIEKEPKMEHEIQLMMYMLFENIERGILLYIGRDNGRLVEYNYSLQMLKEKHEKWFIQKIAELKKLMDQISNRELPDRDYQIQVKNNNGLLSEDFQHKTVKYKTDWQCSYCSYKNLCWKEVYENMEGNAFYINGQFIRGGDK